MPSPKLKTSVTEERLWVFLDIFDDMKKVNIISLGCSKNLVDTEMLLKQLDQAGYDTETDVENSDAEVVIVNTCGFIGDAKEESVNTILEQVERKKEGIVEQVYVIGCLSQRYGAELQEEIPEVDAFFGKFDWKGVLERMGEHFDERIRNQRVLTTPDHYAYLKISEGCNRTCSYCAIPIMTGKHKSRDFEELLEECRALVKGGVKEILVVAQDLTYYGIDLYGKNRLAELIGRIADIEGLEWIKLHYAYPAGFPLELLTVMRERPNVCKYLDIALQHCSDYMLQQMRRGISKKQTIELIRKIRQEVPGIFIRTTLMTGHPGETAEDFEELCEFVREMRFERLGVFPYSHEDDTWCDRHYQDDVPEEIKRERAGRIMQIQAGIAEEIGRSQIGQVVKVLIDRREEEYYVGRTEHDSPEVDPEVLIPGERTLQVGEFYRMVITGADEYDLFAEIREEVKLYKEWREVLQFGQFYRLKGHAAKGRFDTEAVRWNIVSPDGTRAVGITLQNQVLPNYSHRYLKTRGLLEDRIYHVYNRSLKYDIRRMGDLINTVSPIPVKQDSLLHGALSHLVQLDGEKEDHIVTGSILNKAGIPLASGYQGTGFEGNTAFYQDYDARIFLIEEAVPAEGTGIREAVSRSGGK